LREGIWQSTQINKQTKKHEIANIIQQSNRPDAGLSWRGRRPGGGIQPELHRQRKLE
jgi:hypothetical protein